MRIIQTIICFISFALISQAQADSGTTQITSHVLTRQEALVDIYVENGAFTNAQQQVINLHDTYGTRGAVLVIRDIKCPLCKRYGPKLGRLSAKYAKEGLPFVFVYVNKLDRNRDILAEKERFGFTGVQLIDFAGHLGQQLQLSSTTETLLIDSTSTLIYRGGVDDQYGIGVNKAEPEHHYLINAIAEMKKNHLVSVPTTTAPGCVLEYPPLTPQKKPTTWHREISRIMQRNCQPCHHDGGIGPFPFMTYEEVVPRKKMIQFAIEENIMPPWFASTNCGPWRNDLTLPASHRDALLDWVRAGAPEGEKATTPNPLVWNREWQIGEPDYVLEIAEAIPLPAEGTIPYLYAYIETDLPEDKWVKAIEIRSQARENLHHALVFPLTTEVDKAQGHTKKFARRATVSYFACYGPGVSTTIYPKGLAKKLAKGTGLKFQLHYISTGTATNDHISIGLKFSDQPPKHEVRTSALSDHTFSIPPHAADHTVTLQTMLKESGYFLGFGPHMHLRGKKFTFDLIDTNQQKRTLFETSRYDFNWQIIPQLIDPIPFSSGMVLKIEAVFDNSKDNLANPDPNQTVTFGLQTTNEMLIGYFDWFGTAPPAPASSESN